MSEQALLRADLQQITRMVPQGATVLDVGCGSGELLAWLVENKQVRGRGLELQPERVSQCIGKGLAVVQGNAETDLDYYLRQSFDIVILSRTLQAMHDPVAILQQVIRIGRQAIVAIPNFGYWKNRFHLGWKGRMSVTQTLSYAWYDTPNIHFCTLRDFEILCQEQGIHILQRCFLNRQGEPSTVQSGITLPNLLAEQGIFLVEAR